MKNLYFLIVLFALLSSCQEKNCFESGESNFIIVAGNNKMEVSPCGARIVSLKNDGFELLTTKKEHEYFGSTLWAAPQKNWGWPPYPTLDEKPYKAEKIGDTLIMKSENDTLSGFSMSKKFWSINDSCIAINYTIKNISNQDKYAGAWEVTRVACNGLAFFPYGEKANIPASNLQSVDTMLNATWYTAKPVAHGDGQKLFSTASNGWLAFATNGYMFIKKFTDTHPDTYSPEQGEVEIFAENKGKYIELENHGPYTLLMPGQELNYTVFWYLLKINDKVDLKNQKQLLTYVDSIIR